jgi:dienelactone hydrolase
MKNYLRSTGSLAFLSALLGLGLPLFAAAPARAEGVKESNETYESTLGRKLTIHVDRFEPTSEGKHIPIIMVHGASGPQSSSYQEAARQLAGHGYAVFLVHYFDRTGTENADGRTIRSSFLIWLVTLKETAAYIAEQPTIDARKIGLIGYSLGAYLSLVVSAQDPRFGAVVDYFGGLPEQFATNAKKMPPVLILHGDADKAVSVEEAHKLEKTLKENKVPYEIKIYAGQDHGFKGDDAKDAMKRTLAFFDKNLKERASGEPAPKP